MLSYSTGTSGEDETVDKVRAATSIVKSRNPDFAIDGPIQYDAAVDAAVAKVKDPPQRRRRPRQRLYLPGPRRRQHRVQSRSADRQRDRGGADPPGAKQAGERPVARVRPGRYRLRRRRYRNPGPQALMAPLSDTEDVLDLAARRGPANRGVDQGPFADSLTCKDSYGLLFPNNRRGRTRALAHSAEWVLGHLSPVDASATVPRQISSSAASKPTVSPFFLTARTGTEVLQITRSVALPSKTAAASVLPRAPMTTRSG